MRRLDRYVIRELVVPFAIGITVAVVLLVGTMLFAYAKDVIDRSIPVALIGKLILLKLPDFAVIAMPMAMAFAVSLAVNRLARDSEVTSIFMAGVPFRRIVAPVLAVGLLFSGISYLTAEKVAPWANKQANKVVAQIWLMGAEVNSQQDVCLRADEYLFYVRYLYRTAPDYFLLRDVIVYDMSTLGRNRRPVWYIAPTVKAHGRAWVMDNVIRRDIGPDGTTARESYLPQLTIILRKDVDFLAIAERPEELPSPVLQERIRMLRAQGEEKIALRMQIDYLFRISLPFACLVFGLLAAPLSLRFSHGGTFVGVLVSIVVGFLYWNGTILSKVLGANGVVPPQVAAWGQNVLFGLIGAWMVRRS